MTAYTPAALFEAEKAFAAKHGLKADFDALRGARERAAADLSSDFHRMAAWVVAPVLAGFAHWLAEYVGRNKGGLNLAVMREGRLIGALLRELHGLPSQEIWLNRDLSMRAAFGCGDDEALLNWLVRTRMQVLTRGEAIRLLSGEIYSGADAEQLLDLDAARQLMKEWEGQGALTRIRDKARGIAERLMLHWRNAVGDTPLKAPVLLMDFAAVGNIQRSLQTVLRVQGDNAKIIGLNFLMTSGSTWAKQAGCAMHGYLADTGEPSWMAQAYARTPELIEIFSAAPVGPLEDYEADGRPVNGEIFVQQEAVRSAQVIILKAAAHYGRELGAGLTADFSRCIWGRVLLEPLPVEVAVLADWPLDAGLDGAARRILAPRLSGDPQNWTKMQSAWPAGSLMRGRI